MDQSTFVANLEPPDYQNSEARIETNNFFLSNNVAQFQYVQILLE